MDLDLALDDSLTITSPFEAAIQELDLLFSTENTEMLGNPEFGVNMEQFLWQLTPSPSEVESYLQKKILENTFWCNKLNVSINVDVLRGTIRNIYEVKIELKMPNNGSSTTKTYQFK